MPLSLPGSSDGSVPNLGFVELNGIPLRLRGAVQTEIINMYARKTNIGEQGPETHPVNSTIIQGSWQGGGQVWRINPAQDMQRFWWSTLMSEYPEFLTLPPLTDEFDPPVAGAAPVLIGDFPNDDTAKLYASAGGRLIRFNDGSQVWDNLTAMATAAVANGVTYTIQTGGSAGTTLLYIPQGSQYQTWNGAALSGAVASSAISFAIWDNKLFRLTTAGTVHWTTDGSTWFQIASIPDGSKPRKLVEFLNRNDQPTIYVETNYYTWALNFDAQSLVQTKLYVPRHPIQGLGAVQHQGEYYKSAGLGVTRYNLSTLSPGSGPDHDQGLPVEYRGHIVDLVSSYNGLFALIRGANSGEAVTEGSSLDVGMSGVDMYASSVDTNSLLLIWNGEGWHYRWSGSGTVPVNAFVSQADGLYKIWWSAGGKLLSQQMTTTYFNPRDPSTELVHFAEEGDWESGWFDWGWQGSNKMMKRLEFGTLQGSETEVIEVYYKIDLDSADWVHVGDITSGGKHIFPTGLDVDNPLMADGTPRYRGIKHERFRLRFVFRRGSDITKKPVMMWWAIVGRKLPDPQRSWRFNVDLTKQQKGYPPGFTTHLIEELPGIGYAVPFKHRRKMYMVDVVAISGPDDVEDNIERSFRTIHLMESNEMTFFEHTHEAA